MESQNILDIVFESENYTYVYPGTLEMLFPGQLPSPDIVVERPSSPLRERNESEKARLRTHPLFQEEY